MRTFIAASVLLSLAGCALEEGDDGRDDSFSTDDKADGTGVAAGSPLAYGVLGVANRLTAHQLQTQVGLSSRVAGNIVGARADGNLFTNLDELDEVPWVGSRALASLSTYARSAGWVEPVDALAADRAAHLQNAVSTIKADGVLSFAEADQLIEATLYGHLTLASMRDAKHFVDTFSGTSEQGARHTDALWGARAVLETIYFGMPRTITGLAGSGQSVEQRTTHHATQIFFEQREADPNRLVFSGAAAQPYQLMFWIFETRVVVEIPAGSTAAQTAARVAAAINANHHRIVPQGDYVEGQIQFDSDTHPFEIAAHASGAEVLIQPSLDS